MRRLQQKQGTGIAWMVLILTLAIFQMAWGQTSQNLTKNALGALGSFEWDSHSRGVADSWELLQSGLVTGNAWLDPNASARDGQFAQRWDVLSSTGAGYVRIGRNVRVGGANQLQVGDNLIVSAYRKTSAKLTNCYVEAFVMCYDANWRGLKAVSMVTPASGKVPQTSWAKVSSAFKIPSNTAWVSIYFYLQVTKSGASGTSWIDQVVVDNLKTYTPKPRTGKWLKVFGRPTPDMDLYDVAGAMDLIYIPESKHEDVQTLRMLNPNIKAFLYEAMGMADQYYSTTPESSDPIGHDYIAKNHPEWFMRDAAGKYIYCKGYYDPNGKLNLKVADFGNAAYQNMWAEKAIQKAKSEGFDGVHIDGVAAYMNWTTDGIPVGYSTNGKPDDTKWRAGITSFLKNVVPKIRAAGLQVLANYGNSDWNSEPWKTWKEIISGGFEEHCFLRGGPDGPKGKYVGETTWNQETSSLAGASGRLYVAMSQVTTTDVTKRRFALGSFLLGMGTNNYFGLAETSKTQVPTCTDFDVSLGAPREAYKLKAVQSGKLYVRTFDKGIVYVNSSEKTSAQVDLPQDYKTLDGAILRKGTRLSVAPLTSQILIAQATTVTPTPTPTTPKKTVFGSPSMRRYW